MNRIPRKIRGFDGVGWSNRAQVRLAGGPTYHEIELITNAVDADILRVSLTVNGDVKFDVTGTVLRFFEKYKKKWEESGRLVIALADLALYSLEGQLLRSLHTVPTDNIILEVQFGTGAASVVNPLVTPPTISANSLVSNPLNAEVASAVIRTRLVNLKGGGSGLVTLDNLHQQSNGREVFQRIHFDGRDGGANDYITDMEIRRDGSVIWEQSTASMRYDLKRNDLAPQAGFYHFDSTRSRFLSELMNSQHATSLEFRLQLSNAMATIPAILETIEYLG